jgi:hypothetical protein
MILDERTELADAASLIAAAGTAVLGDVIDISSAAYDLGLGEDIWLIIQVDTSIVAAAAGTLQFFVVSDALDTLGGGVVANCTTHLATASLVTATTAPVGQRAGDTLVAMKLPAGVNYERYLGILRTIGTSNITAGRVNAFVTRDYSRWLATADAVN